MYLKEGNKVVLLKFVLNEVEKLVLWFLGFIV